jgi:hypothetical protein
VNHDGWVALAVLCYLASLVLTFQLGARFGDPYDDDYDGEVPPSCACGGHPPLELAVVSYDSQLPPVLAAEDPVHPVGRPSQPTFR